MKQHITSEQLNEFLEYKIIDGNANFNQERLSKINKALNIDSNRSYPPFYLINVGLMIEMLENELQGLVNIITFEGKYRIIIVGLEDGEAYSVLKFELNTGKNNACDALWEVIKNIEGEW